MVLRTLFLSFLFFGLMAIYACKSEYAPNSAFHPPAALVEIAEDSSVIPASPAVIDEIIDRLTYLL